MVCKNCGSNIPETSKFCTTCGATVEEAPAAQGALYGEPATKNKSKLMKLIIPIAAGVVALVVALILIFGGSYKTPVKNYFKAIESGSGSKLQSCYSFSVKAAKADGESSAEIKEDYKDRAEDLNENYADRYGKDFKIKYKIKDTDEWDKDEIEDMEELLNELIEEEDAKMGKVRISKVVEVEVEVEVKGSEDEAEFDKTFTVAKINGKWSLVGF